MKNSVHNFTSTVGSLFLFSVAAIGLAGFSYELFSANGQIRQWLSGIWEFNPLLLIVLGGAFLLIKHWLESINPGKRLADGMVICALMSGLYILFKVFIGG